MIRGNVCHPEVNRPADLLTTTVLSVECINSLYIQFKKDIRLLLSTEEKAVSPEFGLLTSNETEAFRNQNCFSHELSYKTNPKLFNQTHLGR